VPVKVGVAFGVSIAVGVGIWVGVAVEEGIAPEAHPDTITDASRQKARAGTSKIETVFLINKIFL
jgi:hypothetical protein